MQFDLLAFRYAPHQNSLKYSLQLDLPAPSGRITRPEREPCCCEGGSNGTPGRLDAGQCEVMKAVGWHGQGGGPVEGPVDGPVGVRVEGVAILPETWWALQAKLRQSDGVNEPTVAIHPSTRRAMQEGPKIIDIVDITCQRSIGFLSI
jgi:hypothetical protein